MRQMHYAPLLVLAAWATILVAKVGFIGAQAKDGGYDNAHPRDQQARLEGRAKRALAAHQNGFENFPPFAAAMLFAFVVGVPSDTVNKLGLTFVLCRLVYNYLYIANKSTLRSLIWGLGSCCSAALFIFAFFRLQH